ncbi:hypothetical protein BDV97DRAFT_348896 [Delphinella strobiligena]|nr:hypothetical protein BDV97DRAFT_348896 [Delphinella strobiligena]
MANIVSLGLNRPSALPFLISESILPEHADESSYHWHTCQAQDGLAEEELLYTSNCVVWSIGGTVRKVFNFHGQDRRVHQALLTNFSHDTNASQSVSSIPAFATGRDAGTQFAHEQMQRTTRWGTKGYDSKYTIPPTPEPASFDSPSQFARALVIVLATEVQIHFLSGPSHLVNLPFEVQQAYSSVQGIIIRRTNPASVKEPSSPQPPPPPPYPSFASQTTLSQSMSTPTIPSQYLYTGRDPGVIPQLDSLFRSIAKDNLLPENVDLQLFYSLTDPLSDFAVVSQASFSRPSRLARLENPDELLLEYGSLDQDEEIVYVSPRDELASNSPGKSPLLFMVTRNSRLQQITVWQNWYLKSQSLSTLLSQRAAHKAAKARERSATRSTSRLTTTGTPILRNRDRPRESYAASARTTDFAASQNSGILRQSQDDEEVMASQMDPDYLPLKKPGKASKRVSSILSRTEIVNSDPSIKRTALGESFGGGGRRGPSIGSFHDRRSFGSYVYRKSRGSTPGSIFSRSIGPGGDLTDTSTRLGEDGYLNDEYDASGRLISATLQGVSMDAAFGNGVDGLRRELITRKMDSVPLYWQPGNTSRPESSKDKTVKVFPLVNDSVSKNGDRHLDLYILDRSSGNMVTISYRIRDHRLPDLDHETVPIPVMDDRKTVTGVYDVEMLGDGCAQAVLYSTVQGGLKMIPAQGLTWPVSLPRRMRLSDPTSVQHMFEQTRREVGRTRTTELEIGPFLLQNPGRSGEITLQKLDGQSHRLQILLSPRNTTVSQILQVCQLALRGKEGRCIPTLWCSIYHRFTVGQLHMTQGLDLEWEALIVALFTLAVGSIGRAIKVNPQSQTSELSHHITTTAYDSQLGSRSVHSESDMFANKSWAWLQGTRSQRKRLTRTPRSSRRRGASSGAGAGHKAKYAMAEYEAMARHCLHDIATDELEWLVSPDAAETRTLCSSKVMLALHLYREESKLNLGFENHTNGRMAACLSAVIAQFGHWLGLQAWDCKPDTYYDFEGASERWEISRSTMRTSNALMHMHLQHPSPPLIYEWIGQSLLKGSREEFTSLEHIANMETLTSKGQVPSKSERRLLPRLCSLQQLAAQFGKIQSSPEKAVEVFQACGLSVRVIETFPEAILAPIREAVTRCQSSPPTTWPSSLLRFTGRDDLVSLSEQGTSLDGHAKRKAHGGRTPFATHDMQTVYAAADRVPIVSKTHEAERHAVISLIFSEDRRLVDALRLMNPTAVQVAECPPQPEWSEVEHLDQQKRVINWVMVRTIALAPGFAMVHFESQRPLLSEHFSIKGFSTSCQMKPMDNTISADRSTFTEEKFGWAFFHSGVAAGLSISQDARGIDTSWIVFNKPNELGNRHAGFLLALGINGHLRTLAKWLAFKYLTPKHNMTSIGLLLGLSASYIGTMDALITRMLSVHITRMLPAGAAELNVSPTTQTAGLMGIGLLYYNTQHRRMSEVMLSEIEHREIEDPGSTMDVLRDESYRLAAGFALGYINIGKGRNLQGLRSMQLLERLLNVAIGPRPVDLVHVVDKATAGAIMAVTLIYMKTEDNSVAQKITIPDTIAQLEHVRPDLLMLRIMTKYMIMWSEISDEPGWICANLPKEFSIYYYGQGHSGSTSEMIRTPQLKSSDVPFFNVITGLAWSLGLRYAGSRNCKARDEVLGLLKIFSSVAKQQSHYYDAKLTRNTVRRCIDVLALSAATIMAGTGDLETFRHLRSLHGRVDIETSYGSHMATHLAIGALFLGGGTYTFGTSNFAIAALICAFYPLFPSDVSDNRVHLQALRHLWVFAAEPRCLVVQDIDTARPISMKLKVILRDGFEITSTAPCLLPELNTIARINTQNPAYWQVTLDFAGNAKHLDAFRRHQTIYVRRSHSFEFSSTVFSSTLAGMNDVQSGTAAVRGMWKWVSTLPAFAEFDQAVLDLVLPPDNHSAVHLDEQSTVYDTRLVLSKSVVSQRDRDALWNLRLLFGWAQDALEHGDGRLKWIGRETIDMLRSRISQRMRLVAPVA